MALHSLGADVVHQENNKNYHGHAANNNTGNSSSTQPSVDLTAVTYIVVVAAVGNYI